MEEKMENEVIENIEATETPNVEVAQNEQQKQDPFKKQFV